ncbi:hypothetical protein FPZ12_018085 [Amycolatopsis acidicola]|uniref:Uncharacterized protein n=1 Tax=Amycolatopsis acidicola TaxID=2596893 RepID=A0A5N0V2L4_9PSEU|nr:hypothetical protein [Amycolatopsis acidicola]KAA9160255.1 hypothetical protein FPZ12_018085 [Amycolatopsis acidicola]
MAMPEMESPEPQELLEMRLVALCQDIDKVKQVADDARRRRASLDHLDELICRYSKDSVWVQLQESNTLVAMFVDVMARDPALKGALDDHGLLDRTLDMVGRLETIKDRLGKARDEVAAMGKSMVDISQDTALTISLTERCRKLGKEVETLLTQLRDGEPPRDVWARYERKLENECQDLFADYVDFLGGLTLRDHALDDEVCDITDRLLWEMPGQLKRLSLPARRPTLHSALNELVKLGFPGWTIWNIPLVGAEIGAAQARKPLGDWVLDQVPGELPEPVCRALFAEAYAAYTVGPAYGCAATLLKFQPNHDEPGEATPSDLQRAAVIVRVLREVSDDLPEIGQVVDRIEEFWLEAVSKLDSDLTATGPLDDFSDAVVGALRSYEVVPFGPDDWDPVDRTVELLRESDRPHRAPTGLSARVLLNAAWVTRLERPGSKEWAHDVTKNVKALWKSMGGKRG